MPLAINGTWTIEPQAQIIGQQINPGHTNDPFTTIDYQSFGALTGRLGVRLEGNLIINNMQVQPFGSVDVWHDFTQTTNVTFNDRNVATPIGGTSLEFRGGAAVHLASNVSAFGALEYTTNVDGELRRSIGGNVGFRVKW